MEPAIQSEATAVIAAAQLLLVSCSIDHERPAMRAHVRERMHLVLRVAREEERLIERTG